jgi:hypothetical protein
MLGHRYRILQLGLIRVCLVGRGAINKRVDKVGLLPRRQFPPHKVVDLVYIGLHFKVSFDRLAPRRQVPNLRHIEVAEDRKGKAAGNGGCAHHEQVGR